MQTTNDFAQDGQLLLDLIGGEPLTGSGFEAEEPVPEYRSAEEE